MKGKLNCAVYTRVSTDNQAEKEFNSCEAQKEKIEHFIRSQVGFGIYDVFNDEGYSGRDLNRPALQAMLGEIERDRIDCVITYKMDRLTRSPKDFYQLIEYFNKYRVDFISVTERFDTSTPSGRLLRNIMLTFAQFERELASERTRDKLLQRAEKGMWNGGVVPYGYKCEGKKLIINGREARGVRKIYEMYIKTGSVSQVYDFLKRKNIRDRKGKIFSKTFISYILQNIVYIGKIKYGKKIYQGIHEPIISEVIFNLAQQKHKEPPNNTRKYKEYLFSGMVICKECGSVMTSCYTSKKTKWKKKRYYYYRCTSTLKRDWGACSIKQVSSKRLEEFVFNTLKRIISDRYYIESIVNRANDLVQRSSFSEHGQSEMSHRTGFGKHEHCSCMEPDIFRQSLEKFIIAAEKSTPSETRELIKNCMQSIQYSKEEIVINMYYEATSNNEERNLQHVAEGHCPRPQANTHKRMVNREIRETKNEQNSNKPEGCGQCNPRRPDRVGSAEEMRPKGAIPLSESALADERRALGSKKQIIPIFVRTTWFVS